LNPVCPKQRALDKLLVHKSTNACSNYYKVLAAAAAAGPDAKTVAGTFLKGLEMLEVELTRRGTPFFGERTPMMVDYNLWPWFERFPSLTHFSPASEMKPERFSHLLAWMARMKSDKVVAQASISDEVYTKYTHTYIVKDVDTVLI
jgi:glutathione S-transferase